MRIDITEDFMRGHVLNLVDENTNNMLSLELLKPEIHQLLSDDG